MSNVFHEGEIDVQQRAGVQQMAARVGQGIRPMIPPAAANFLKEQPFVIIASADSNAQLWASILVNEPPFMHSQGAQTIRIDAFPKEADPLHTNLKTDKKVGLIAIEFESRRRMRFNGTAELLDDAFLVHTEQVYANCPKYIQARTISGDRRLETAVHTTATKQLSADQTQWINTADTFFIASADLSGNADASHRGGNRGFVLVENYTHLIWPDYAGNMMFNTLGNIAVNPSTGLLFIDFERNRTLQLTGRAEIVWDKEQIAQFKGAERLLRFEIEQVIETQNALPFAWTFQSYSPFNPGKY